MLPNILTIYTTGDALFLQNVLNAIAMVTGTGSFVTASALGLLFGIILMAFKSLQTGKGFDLASIVICWIAWNFFFGATATVNIHDVITEEDRPVDNVPAGVAIAGWGISNIGYGITEIMEQAFQSPYSESTITGAMAGNGGVFNDTVRTLNTVATIGLNPQILASIDQDNGPKSNFRVSASNFIKDCTLTAFDLGYRSEQNIFNKSLKEGIDFPEANGVYFTRIIDGSGTNGGVTVSCDTAFDRIDNMMDKALRNSGSYTNTTLTGLLTGHEHKTENSSLMGEGMQKASDLFNSMSAMNADVQEFMKTAIMFDMFSQGEMKQARDSRDFATSLMMVQARQQRNMQWSAESNMFQKTMRPIMTFMEGFTYAITPFCGFLLLLGMFGVKLSLKYFMLIAWVQSWLPCLAIANAYLNSSLQRAIWGFHGMDTTTYDPNSFMAVKVLADTTQDFLATGGMFIGAIPVVTLFIFSGSVYALNSLAGRMNGQDFINEKVASPDAISPAPLMQALSQQDTQFGVGAQTRSNWDNISFGYSDLSSVQAAKNKAIALSSNYSSELSHAYQEQFAINKSKSIGDTFSKAVGSATSEGESFLSEIGQQYIDSFNKTHGTNISGSNGFSAMIGANLFRNAKLGAQGGVTLSESEGSQISAQDSDAIAQKIQNTKGSQLGEKIDSAISNNKQLIDQFNQSASNQKSLKDSWSKAKSAQTSYNESMQTAQQSQITKSWTIPQISRDLKNYGAARAINQLFNSQSQDNEYLRDNADAYYRRLNDQGQLSGLTQEEARAVANIKALSEVSGDQGAWNRYNIVQALEGKEMSASSFSTNNNAKSVSGSEIESNLNNARGDVVDSMTPVQNEVIDNGVPSYTENSISQDNENNNKLVKTDHDAQQERRRQEFIQNNDSEISKREESIKKNNETLVNARGVKTPVTLGLVNTMNTAMAQNGMDPAKFNRHNSGISDTQLAKTTKTASEQVLAPALGKLNNFAEAKDNKEEYDSYSKYLVAEHAAKYANETFSKENYVPAMRGNNSSPYGSSDRSGAISKLEKERDNALNDFLKVSGMTEDQFNKSSLKKDADLIVTNDLNGAGLDIVQNAKDNLDLIGKNKRVQQSLVNSNNNSAQGVNSNNQTQPVVQEDPQNGSATIQTSNTTNIKSGPVNTNLNATNRGNTRDPVLSTSSQNLKQTQPVVQSSSQRVSANKPVVTLNKK